MMLHERGDLMALYWFAIGIVVTIAVETAWVWWAISPP
jgi:hypothetical protein